MNAKQADNLRILIRHMETVCGRTLNMAAFEYPCGTPACALGEACIAVPALMCQPGSIDARAGVEFTEAEVFGLAGRYRTQLFGIGLSNAWGRNKVAPQEWATEARKVLAEGGYTMDAPNNAAGYAAFMAKVMQPVAVTA